MEDFKLFEEMLQKDVRWKYFAFFNHKTLDRRAVEMRDHYESVNRFMLDEAIPETIRSQFNISKNVLLYAWLFYPFFSVAEMHVLSVLELALKLRIGESPLSDLNKQGLYHYIKYACDSGWIRNEDFSAYHRAPYETARHEYVVSKIKEMNEKGLDSSPVDFGEIEVPVENNFNHIEHLLKTVNRVRNMHAHGDPSLNPNSAWESFEMCSEFINTIYKITNSAA